MMATTFLKPESKFDIFDALSEDIFDTLSDEKAIRSIFKALDIFDDLTKEEIQALTPQDVLNIVKNEILRNPPVQKVIEKIIEKKVIQLAPPKEKEKPKDEINQIEELKKKIKELEEKIKEPRENVNIVAGMMLPNYSSANGKVLTVQAGALTWGTPAASSGGTSPDVYTPANVTTLRSYDANDTSLDELADVLGSLIASLQGAGIIQ
jgi:hypothetical protein